MSIRPMLLLLAALAAPLPAAAQGELRVSATVLPPQGVELDGGEGVTVRRAGPAGSLELPVSNRGALTYLIQLDGNGPARVLRGRERMQVEVAAPRGSAPVTCVIWPMT